MSPALRLAVVQPILSPIRRPLWEIVAAAPGVDLKVFVLTRTMPLRRDWDVRQEEKFDVEVVGAIKQRVTGNIPGGDSARNMRLLAPQLAWRVGAWKPDALVCSNISEFLMLLPLRLMTSLPIGATVADTPFTASCYGALRKKVRAFLYRRMDFYVAYGTEAEKYVTSIGVAQDSVKHGMWSVDNSLYKLKLKNERVDEGVRSRWTSVGALIPQKGFLELLRAWCLQPPDFLAANQLVIVGEGPEEVRLRKFIADNLPPKSAILAGYRTPRELATLYFESDVFIFPSLYDVWGLVVNEAMASGLPIVCSKYAGCHSDVVGKSNGVIVDPLERDSFAREIYAFWRQRDHWNQMGRESRQMISGFTLEATAAAIIESATEARDRQR